MKKYLLIIGLAIISLTFQSLADEDVIDLVPIPTATPAPIPYPGNTEPEYDLDESDVEILAEFLWKSPLRYEHQKRELLWIVFNRIDDDSGLFSDSIEEVCRNRHEFTFMTAHRYALSDENMRIAREELQRWNSKHLGSHIGECHNGVYCSFVGERNRGIEVYDKDWKKVAWK